MAVFTRTFAAATISWINPNTGLPENDTPVLDKNKSRADLTGSRGFRFCNFAEPFVQWNSFLRRATNFGFGPESAIYRAPSFLKLPSHAFPIQQRMIQKSDCIEFIQIAGARTVTAEVGGTVGGAAVGAGAGALLGTFVFPGVGTGVGAAIGAAVGAPSGEIVAHQGMNFPPIWSKLKIVMFNDGQSSASVLQYSHFPSVTFYKEISGSSGKLFELTSIGPTEIYHAKNSPEAELWHKCGWGVSVNSAGPSDGNPWGVAKGVTGGKENIPN